MDLQPKRTDQLLVEWGETRKTHERSNRYPTIMRSPAPTIAPRTEPRPMRIKELLERQQDEELIKRSASASKICLENKFILTTGVNIKITNSENTPTPLSHISPYAELRPLRTKELLERQRLEELNKRSNSSSRIRSTASKMLKTPTPSLLRTPQTRRQLQFTPTPEKTTTATAEKIKRLASQLQQVLGLNTLTEQKLRQLTITDFVSILNRTLPFTGVLPVDLRLNKDNYVEKTVIALERLKYPHRVNTSYLKMPGTRHGLNIIVDIIDFLLDFALVGNMLKVFEHSDDETFNNVAKSYRKWPGNRKDILPQLLYTDLKDQFNAIEEELEQIQIAPELAQLLSEKDRIEKELITLQNDLKDLLNESSQLTKNMAQLCTDNWRLMKTIDSLQNVVVNQKHSYFFYQSKLNLHVDLQDRLKLCRYQLHEFSERFRLLHLKRRRSRKEFLEHIEAYNVLVRDIEYSSVMGISCSNLELALPTSLEEIEKRRLLLQHLRNFIESFIGANEAAT